MRERLAFGDDLPLALAGLGAYCHGGFIVSTCNRSEIYAYVDDPITNFAKTATELVAWFAKQKGFTVAELSEHLYLYEGNLALTHWLRVAVGLDSMVLGEPQILGQLRQAVAQAEHAGTLGLGFAKVCQHVFAAARTIRRDTDLGKQAVTLGFAASKLVTQIFDKPNTLTLLVVAAGEMNRLVAQNIASLGVARIIICNRSQDRADELHRELTKGCKHQTITKIPFCQLEQTLAVADIVSSCSGSMHILIGKTAIKTAMKQRKNRPMLLIDLAVPRDIDPQVAKLDGVYLYSVDDLQHVIEGNMAQRRQAAVEAELLVGQLVSAIETKLQMAAMGDTITQYQHQMNGKKQTLLAHAKHRLGRGDDPTLVLDEFCHRLSQTLTHPPVSVLRQACQHLDDEALLWLRQAMVGTYRPN